jgi:3-methylfumaryl-CoA hydratase
MSTNLEHLRDWIGRKQTRTDVATSFQPRALVATLDTGDPEPKDGDPLPPAWHWMYFVDLAPAGKLGPDGHAERGEFLPPVPLPRRMWAGSRFRFSSPLRIGETIRRDSEIVSVQPKTGATGPMVFVVVRHTVSGAGGGSFVEEHDIVYREAAKPGDAGPQIKAAPTDATWSKTVTADPVMLFRYSALTFNGHRIHYDHPYVTEVEGYGGLVVHGPLMGTMMIELARRSRPDRAPATYEFRAMSPVFHTMAFTVNARQESDGSLTTWIANDTGGLAQLGKVTFS